MVPGTQGGAVPSREPRRRLRVTPLFVLCWSCASVLTRSGAGGEAGERGGLREELGFRVPRGLAPRHARSTGPAPLARAFHGAWPPGTRVSQHTRSTGPGPLARGALARAGPGPLARAFHG